MWHQLNSTSGEVEHHGGDQPCVCNQPPIETLDIKAQVGLSFAILYAHCHTSLLEEVSAIHVTPWEEDGWRLVPGTLSVYHFLLLILICNFALYQTVTMSINSFVKF